MNVERNLPVVRERKLAILKGDPELCAQQKKAGKLIARERIGLLLDAASFVELDVLNCEAGVVTGYGLIGYMNGGSVQNLTVEGTIDLTNSASVSNGYTGGVPAWQNLHPLIHPLKSSRVTLS